MSVSRVSRAVGLAASVTALTLAGSGAAASATLGAGGSIAAASVQSSVVVCDEAPTGVQVSDHFLPFTVPAGLMPDPQFNGLMAELQVHRVQPVYANGKCPSVPSRAAVLVHDRTTGSPVFDLRDATTGGGEFSVQETLARAGIDSFAPSLLGYGRSTRFAHGLDDPGNASLRAHNNDGTCSFPEGCDRTHNPNLFPLDQQGTDLLINPLEGQRLPHSSNVRFARVDTFVRDIRQVIDDAIARAQPTDGKVTLVGFGQPGGESVARTLYAANPNPILPNSDQYIAKVNRVVFLSSSFGFPTEETPPAGGAFATFPLHVTDATDVAGAWEMTQESEAACTGHVIPGSQDQLWQQIIGQDLEGRFWGGDDPANPTGLSRTPTFSSYGWNTDVAGQLTTPTLVIHGVEDQVAPVANASSMYGALPDSMTNKVLVQVECASHHMLLEGCSGTRCTPASGTPYGGTPGEPWDGPHATVKASLIEWITNGTFNGAPNGQFMIDESGVTNPTSTPPTITVADGGRCVTDTSGSINLTVDDAESPPGDLVVTATSANQALVPNANITVGGSGANRSLSVATVASQSGTATVTAQVSDGVKTSTVDVTVIAGGRQTDTISGTVGPDMIFGKNGDDTIAGQNGNDLLCGGNGNDQLVGNAGDDTMYGANGDDVLSGGTGADHFSGGKGTDTATDLTAAQGDTQDGTIP